MKTELIMTFRNLITLIFLIPFSLRAQELTQTVRGTITDKSSGETLMGAVVVLEGSEPIKGTSSDYRGDFKLTQVPVGRRTITISLLGYQPAVISNVLVNSGKELVLKIEMEEALTQLATVEVTADKKSEPLNSMTSVSARTFSVEETQKFAAAVNDPGRMALSYAGVVSGNDGGNIISVRGNSPYAMQWRMEGADIPNPNHFAGVAVSGGGISILSAQTLSNSDFLTGAFSAEYGNVLGGVFDLKLRKGNNEKRENTVQLGVLGIDLSTEGPFKKGYAGSYLVNYRYSTLTLLGKIGVPIGDALTNFQDLSFNFYLPTQRLGSFEIYGFGGLSSQTLKAEKDTSKWDYAWQRYNSTFLSNTGVAGVKHLIQLSDKTYLQSNLVASAFENGYNQEKLSYLFQPTRDYEEANTNTRILLSSVLNHKVNAKHNFRTGVYLNTYGFDLHMKRMNLATKKMETLLSDKGRVETMQTFLQWKYRHTEKMTLLSGVHVLYLPFNDSYSVEPRLGVRYQLDQKQTFSLGYGLHSQMQPVGIYRAKMSDQQGVIADHNKNLGLNKAHHFVAGYQRNLTPMLYAKAEVYYQHLYNIAVHADSNSTLSTLNNIEGYITKQLNNDGKGRNYGLEITLEQYTHKNLYFLLSTSIFQSHYKAMDDVWRNTRFNFGHSVSFTAGKEWSVGKTEKNKVLGANIRLIHTGGMYETPINLSESIVLGEAVYYEDRAYSQKVSNYFRTDVRISLRRNYKWMTTTLALDLQNATNNKNVFGSHFEPESGTIETSYQVPLLPVLSYRLEF
jgi:hypothetical protein